MVSKTGDVRTKHEADLAWITKQIREQGLAAYEEKLLSLIRPGIRIQTKKPGAKTTAIGTSHIGGNPDLPADLAWPQGGEGMLFVAQLNLAVISPMDTRNLLPQNGLLSFFVDRYVDVLQVFHFPDIATLSTRENTFEPFSYCDITLTPELHLPPPSSHFIGFEAPAARPGSADRMESQLALPQGVFEKYWDHVYLAFVAAIEGKRRAGENAVHQVLGYAHGLDDTGAQAVDEELLLAFDTDDNAQMEWGDCQRPAIFIKREDLLARRFDRVRVTT